MALPSLPPGPRYLFRQLPAVAIPPATVYALSFLSREYLTYNAPLWLLGIAYALSWPIAFTVLVQWNIFTNLRRARSWGAVMPPRGQTQAPGELRLDPEDV